MNEDISRAAAVRTPATSANLGPGFDAFALALGLFDEVTARVAADGLEIDVVGEGADTVPRDESHLVVRSMLAAWEHLGVASPPGLRLRCVNRLPHGRGLGSSAAAIVSGVRLAAGLAPGSGLDEADALALACDLEGHPDNVAACLLGGVTIAWAESGRARAVTLPVHPDVRPVVFVPPEPLSTEVARGLLPDEVSQADAAVNAGRAGLLVAGLTQRPDLLLPGTEDRLHQRYRAPAMPDTLALVEALRDAGVAAVVSGAGPSVLALGTAMAPVDVHRWTPARWRSLEVSVDTTGATPILTREG
jgi:homoserine kinase